MNAVADLELGCDFNLQLLIHDPMLPLILHPLNKPQRLLPILLHPLPYLQILPSQLLPPLHQTQPIHTLIVRLQHQQIVLTRLIVEQSFIFKRIKEFVGFEEFPADGLFTEEFLEEGFLGFCGEASVVFFADGLLY